MIMDIVTSFFIQQRGSQLKSYHMPQKRLSNGVGAIDLRVHRDKCVFNYEMAMSGASGVML